MNNSIGKANIVALSNLDVSFSQMKLFESHLIAKGPCPDDDSEVGTQWHVLNHETMAKLKEIFEGFVQG